MRAFKIDMKVNLSFWMSQLSEEDQKPFPDVDCRLYWGELDLIVTKDQMIPWTKLFPNAPPMTVFENTGHMFMGFTEKQKEVLQDVAKVILRK